MALPGAAAAAAHIDDMYSPADDVAETAGGSISIDRRCQLAGGRDSLFALRANGDNKHVFHTSCPSGGRVSLIVFMVISRLCTRRLIAVKSDTYSEESRFTKI